MKRYLFFLLALGILASCSKDELKVNSEEKAISFMAAPLDDDTKTIIVGGVVNWKKGDEITISDGTNTGVYHIANDGDVGTKENNRMSTFTYKSGHEFTTSGSVMTYTATYGDVDDQWQGAFPGSNCPMSATASTQPATRSKEGTSGTETYFCGFHFTNSCGVIVVYGSTGEIKISKIVINGTDDKNAAKEYALNLPVATKLESSANDKYYIAVPDGTSVSSISLVNSNGNKATKAFSTAYTINKGKRRMLGLDAANYFDKVSSYTQFEPVALKGVFSVSATKKVRFASGNLQAVYNSSAKVYTWQFAENQYDYIGGNPGNTTIGGNPANNAIVDLFGFSTKTTNFGISTEGANDKYSGDFIDWSNALSSSSSDWKTLSLDEWNYLLTSRNGNKYAKANYNGTRGVIIFPDGYTGITSADGLASVNTPGEGYPSKNLSTENWQSMVAGGCVFLPSAGKRNGSTVDLGSANYYLLYWSSTAVNTYQAYNLYIRNTAVVPNNSSGRSEGHAVRLVTEVKQL